jgi:hypothetical protein
MTHSLRLHHLLPLLFAALFILNPIANKSDATQQWASTIVGAIAGGGTGASTGLSGEKFNRQLHQKEIAWIKAHAGEFAKANHLTPEQAQALLTLGALGMVDAKENAAIHGLINRGTLTQEQITNAQNYIKGHVVGETFHDDYHYDDSFGHNQQMFTVNHEQYFDPDYNPNSMKGGITPNTLDLVGFLPAGRVFKGGITKIGRGGKTVEVPRGAVVQDSDDIIEYVIKKRKSKGGDGASSEHIIEKINGKTNSTTHRVTNTEGEIIHQHQDFVGTSGKKRRFPDNWTGTKTINAE